jgi:phenylacetate-CoA ligase
MIDVFLDYKPDLLYGNRSHLDLMALELKRRQIPPEEVRLKLLMVGAEVLHASNRQLLREQFGVEPLDGYGSLELGILAYETLPHDGLHLFENLDYYEFLDNDGNPVPPGTPGRIVVTALTRTLMPFIRYDQGDLAIFKYEDDAEGNTIRKITRIIGRETIYIQLPDGTKCSSYIFLRILEKYIGIVQFRTIQRTINLFEVLVAAEPSYFLSIRDNLLHDLQQHFPPTIHFKMILILPENLKRLFRKLINKRHNYNTKGDSL